MSSEPTIAVVSALIRSQLERGLVTGDAVVAAGGDVQVSVAPPDRVPVGTDERPQLNVFMYLVAPHTAWRQGRGGAPSLSLHYLISAYGAGEYQGELLLGYALRRLRSLETLDRAALADTLGTIGAGAPSPAITAIGAAVRGNQIERLTVLLQALALDELSKLWSALQARYRPSLIVQVNLELANG